MERGFLEVPGVKGTWTKVTRSKVHAVGFADWVPPPVGAPTASAVGKRGNSAEGSKTYQSLAAIRIPREQGYELVSASFNRTCSGCCFWERLSDYEASSPGLCRRFTLLPATDAWPLTGAADWYGEWLK